MRRAARPSAAVHDNSAPTLEQAVAHCDPQSLAIAAGLRDMAGALVITDQDVLDIAAYMRLL